MLQEGAPGGIVRIVIFDRRAWEIRLTLFIEYKKAHLWGCEGVDGTCRQQSGCLVESERFVNQHRWLLHEAAVVQGLAEEETIGDRSRQQPHAERAQYRKSCDGDPGKRDVFGG